ncbi:diguanylate cyclase [Brevundimonas sp. CEF1]|uniref:diguanylate cyclase n=1 Tax=Brevundimonas sp. CEF1 TaxID=3442642 RepID=UPI003F5120F9
MLVRSSDFVFRYGGEEFLVVLTETRTDQALAAADRVRAALQARETKAGRLQTFGVTASIGVAQHGGHPGENYLIMTADEALYRAKHAGRNRVERG